MDLRFLLLDVFAQHPLSGNQLCVVLDGAGLDTDLMQRIAQEIGFSETTFVTEAGGDGYAMRIFTPAAEMPFAGHPSLGTAFALVSEGLITSPATQVVMAGEFEVWADVEANRAGVRQHDAGFGPVFEDRDRLARAAGLAPEDLHPEWPAQPVTTGIAHMLVPAASEQAVVRARPDFPAVGSILLETGCDTYYLFAVTGPGAAKARMFSADLGIPEDPATGSAAGPCGAYLAEYGAPGLPGTVTIRQGEEIDRPSVLVADVAPNGRGSWSVSVSGGVFIVGRGTFTLPDDLRL
jgi:trans-2,3-dihydro-3-hydroxyanthranilate isomerase